jgi:hypothetical protein
MTMRGEWIRIKADLDTAIGTMRIARAIDCDCDRVVLLLYRLAGWFQRHGKYGKIKCPTSVVDARLGVEGFAAAALKVGYLLDNDGVLTLTGRVFDVSTRRKIITRKVRDQILIGATCAVCGSPDKLQIDHAVPVSRGGSCDLSNLQALCGPCNRSKGRRTMLEFHGEA